MEITAEATAQLALGISHQQLFGAMWRYDSPKFHEACTCFLLASHAEKRFDAASVFSDGLASCGGQVSFFVSRKTLLRNSIVHGQLNEGVLRVLADDDIVRSTLQSLRGEFTAGVVEASEGGAAYSPPTPVDTIEPESVPSLEPPDEPRP